MKYKKGLLIGRFQPLHYGHIYLVHEALKHIDEMIIGVGSAQPHQIHGDENPYSYEVREAMLKKMIGHEDIASRVTGVIPLIDHPDDDIWRGIVLEKTGPIDVIVTNNDWVKGIYERVSIPTLSIPLYRRELFEGKKIREFLKDPRDHSEYLPDYVLDILGH